MRAGARGALIAFVLAVGLVDGLPIPTVERAEGFSPGLGRFVASLRRVQGFLLAPVRPVLDALHLSERFALFAGASREKFRLEIAGRSGSDGAFKLLYRAQDERHRFLAPVLQYRRVHGAYNPRTQEAPGGYPAFVTFIARRVFRERPGLREVRVRMQRILIADEGGYTATNEYAHELVRRREEVPP